MDPKWEGVPQHVVAALHREFYRAAGRLDAFTLARESAGDLPTLRAALAETVERLAEPAPRTGPHAAGASPRRYQEGYAQGLREAIAIISNLAAAGEQPTSSTDAQPNGAWCV